MELLKSERLNNCNVPNWWSYRIVYLLKSNLSNLRVISRKYFLNKFLECKTYNKLYWTYLKLRYNQLIWSFICAYFKYLPDSEEDNIDKEFFALFSLNVNRREKNVMVLLHIKIIDIYQFICEKSIYCSVQHNNWSLLIHLSFWSSFGSYFFFNIPICLSTTKARWNPIWSS